MAGVDEEINLDQLKTLKRIFDEADEDGSGELDIDEFVEKLGPHLGGNLSLEQIKQLFMKIDADAGGTVDWEEFTNYMFLERAEEASGTVSENWRLFPPDFREKNDPGVSHRGAVESMLYVEALDKYVTCSRDGSWRLWNGADLKHFRTMTMGSSWVTDCIYMPVSRKLVFTSVDRAISYYDANRGAYELSGRVYASGNMGVPQALTLVEDETGERLVYGDSKGHVTMLLCGTRVWPARDLICQDEYQDYIVVHEEHNDWVSQVTWVPEIGLVSSSIDSTIKVYDFVREKVISTCPHHTKAVHGFVWCPAYSLFASCGLERDIILWQGNTTRRIGELTGHTASVTHIALDERLSHVFTLGADKTIKLWDLRTHRCLQTITPEDWKKPEESKPDFMMYDPLHRRVVTAVHKPYVWVHKLVAQDRTGHMEAVRGALYNTTFSVIVTADENGTVCVWNLLNGQREGRFQKAHGAAKLTCICFDKNERRLVTAGGDGTVAMWNFNNGSKLREYRHKEAQEEITAVIFAADEKRESDAVYAAGWNGKVFVWQDADDDDDVIEEYRTYEGHREDIHHMAAFTPRQLLATGDYEGRITVWNLFSGEKRMSLFHRAERYETSVDRLAWLCPGTDDVPRQQTTPSPTSDDVVVASGARAGKRGEAQARMVLLSCGGDGYMRVWAVGAVGKLMCTLPGAQGRLEQISALCVDREHKHVVVGDTAGHLRVWDVSDGVKLSSPEACRASFKQHSHWRAHRQAVLCLDVVPVRDLIIAGCKDHNVSIWSYDGGMLGVLGDDSWDIDDLRSWRDAEGEDKEEIMPEMGGLYLQVPEEGVDYEDAVAVKKRDPQDDLDLTSLQLVNAMINDKKAKARAAASARPTGLHSQLRLHELEEVPTNARELLARTHAPLMRTTATNSAAAAAAPAPPPQRKPGMLAPKR